MLVRLGRLAGLVAACAVALLGLLVLVGATSTTSPDTTGDVRYPIRGEP